MEEKPNPSNAEPRLAAVSAADISVERADKLYIPKNKVARRISPKLRVPLEQHLELLNWEWMHPNDGQRFRKIRLYSRRDDKPIV